MRRLKAMEMKMEAGEEVSDFFNRLKNEYSEAEMAKATPWSIFICKLIASISDTGNDQIMLKNKLLETFRDIQDPQESELLKFQTVIKQHKEHITAQEFKGEGEEEL